MSRNVIFTSAAQEPARNYGSNLFLRGVGGRKIREEKWRAVVYS
jgi:hypothetical protein